MKCKIPGSILLVLLIVASFSACSKKEENTVAGSTMVPAAQIVPPPGKKLLSLPVDTVSPKPIKIAAIMVQNNPFGQAVLQGEEFAKKILADRNCTVHFSI